MTDWHYAKVNPPIHKIINSTIFGSGERSQHTYPLPYMLGVHRWSL